MHDYLLEKRLRSLDPALHRRAKDSFVVLQKTLESFFSWFPDFTDHSALHSMDVLDFTNRLLADRAEELSVAECYVLIMACYMHDVGMGISSEDYEVFSRELDLEAYKAEHPDADEPRIIRDFHNEFSGCFIRKYADVFDIPGELTFPIVQVSRGHRKTDLYDEKEYPVIELESGVVRTPLLAALIRLADEIDIAADRNPEIMFDTSTFTKQVDIDAFGTHESIRMVDVREDSIVLIVKPKEPRYEELIRKLAEKVQETLDYCREVTEKRSDIVITQKKVLIEPWNDSVQYMI